jgi:cytochrome c553
MAMIKYWVGACLLGYASLTLAEGNAAAGQEKVAACGGCHGEDGNGAAPIFPKLARQHAAYIVKQLHDFKTQKRVEPTMNAMAESLTDQDMQDMAAFYTTQKLTYEQGEYNALGEKLYRTGNPKTGVPACTGCHNPDIEKTLHDFKANERGNDTNAMMRSFAAKLSNEEITALAQYIATFR